MQDFTIAFVSFIRPTFDVQLAQDLTKTAKQELENAGYCLLGADEVVTSIEQAQRLADDLAQEAIDLLVIFMATFNDSTMITTLAQAIDAPMLMWALPEPRDDDNLRLNSLCGINLAGHALTKIGRKYDYVYANVDAKKPLERIAILARTGKAIRLLKQVRIARVGERPPGFETCDYDEEQLRTHFGIEVIPIDLQNEVFARIPQTDSTKVDAVIDNLAQTVAGLDDIDDAPKRKTLSTFVTLDEMAERNNLQGFAMRCWPEFFSDVGCAACAAMSMLSNKGLPASCEVDVHGTITQFILQSMSGQPAFGTDLVSIIEEEDAIALWHCGLAPLAMASENEKPRVTNHVGRKLPLLMDFALKGGTVTVARLNEQQNGGYRLVIGSAEMLDRPKPFHGTSGMMRFSRSAETVMDTIIREGVEHHIAITYGDYVDSLIALADYLDIPVLHL